MARGRYFLFHRGVRVGESASWNHLFRDGVIVGGCRAWRLQGAPRGSIFGKKKGGQWLRRAGRHRRRTLNFSEQILIWNPVTGYRQTLGRSWFLSFFLRLWVACGFNNLKTGLTARQLGVDAAVALILHNFLSAVKRYWPEVKRELKGKYGIDIDKQIEKVQELQNFCYNPEIQQIYGADPVKAAPLISIAANIGNRLIETALAVDKKAENEERASEMQQVFLETQKTVVREVAKKVAEEIKNGEAGK